MPGTSPSTSGAIGAGAPPEVPQSSRVLVIEDDELIRDGVCRLLGRDGFGAIGVATGSEALATLASEQPSAVLLDLGLPDVNGFDLLRSLVERTSAPVIVVSGMDSETDRVLALEIGADDYLAKPYLSGELMARIRRRLRGPRPSHVTSAAPDDVVVDGDLAVDPHSREVTLAGATLDLTPREFDLLLFLMESPRQVFSREQLLSHVWTQATEWHDESTVTSHVHRLRSKVGAARIVTVRNVGYRYEPGVQS